jgi:hypothetical protein
MLTGPVVLTLAGPLRATQCSWATTSSPGPQSVRMLFPVRGAHMLCVLGGLDPLCVCGGGGGVAQPFAYKYVLLSFALIKLPLLPV